jgi:hypothetical protein
LTNDKDIKNVRVPLPLLVNIPKDDEAHLDPLDIVSQGGWHKTIIEERCCLLIPFQDGMNDAPALRWADSSILIAAK